jgi:hypothetical protein
MKILRNVGWTLICLDITELMKVIKSDRKLKSGNMAKRAFDRNRWMCFRTAVDSCVVSDELDKR